jgi:hypothetical protein
MSELLTFTKNLLTYVKGKVEDKIKELDTNITSIKNFLSELKELSNSNDKELTKLMLNRKILRIIDKIDDIFDDIIFIPERLKSDFFPLEGEPFYKRFEKLINEMIPLRDQFEKYLYKPSEIRFDLEVYRDNIIYEISDRINIDVDEIDDFLIKYFLEE